MTHPWGRRSGTAPGITGIPVGQQRTSLAVAGHRGQDAAMAQFTSYDGTKLAFRRAGAGRPLVCLPGGPGRTPDYLSDLGGLGAWRELILPDTRGTGESAAPADPTTYRADRLTRDVEALRVELGLERFDLLGHSAGGSVALLYAAAYPERVDRLVLLSPGMGPLGLNVTDGQQQAAMRQRSRERSTRRPSGPGWPGSPRRS
jgi:pimeloyl-ACP methyl ester carboxylesterase